MASPNGRVVDVIQAESGSGVDLDVNGFGNPPTDEERENLGNLDISLTS